MNKTWLAYSSGHSICDGHIYFVVADVGRRGGGGIGPPPTVRSYCRSLTLVNKTKTTRNTQSEIRAHLLILTQIID